MNRTIKAGNSSRAVAFLSCRWSSFVAVIGAWSLLLVGFATTVSAETRITYKSAKSTSSYYQMAVQIAEAMKAGSDGDISVTVEESQGSVQNLSLIHI